MSLINVANLTFSYETSPEPVFENVSFQIDSSWRLGLTGRNGKGKTTFLKLLMGEYEYRGTIQSSLEFEYFPFPVKKEDRMTLEVLEEICPVAQDWEMLREIQLMGMDGEILYRIYDSLSRGEQTRVLLAGMFLRENAFLLIDEPTNHLDREGRELLADYLRKKKGFILVSHDRMFLDACIDHVLSLNRSDIEVQKGNFSTWWENRRRQDAFEQAEHQKLSRDIRRLQEAAGRNSDWSGRVEKSKKGKGAGGQKTDRGYIGHKSAKMMKRAKVLERRQEKEIEGKSRLLKNVETAETLKIHPLSFHREILAEFSHVSLFYGEKEVCRDLNFTIRQGEQTILRGKNGSGKSSILKLLAGEACGKDRPSFTGDFRLAPGLKISMVPQDTDGLTGNLQDYAAEYDVDRSLFLAILRKLDFSREQFEKRLEELSMGQRKKVLLARSLCEKAHLYVWDEPLNYIDVISRIQIEELIRTYRPSMVLVEHDGAFCKNAGSLEITLDEPC